MTGWLAATLQAIVLVAALVLVHRPLGDAMARVYEGTRHLRVERAAYRLMGVDPDADQRWTTYLRSVLAFSLVSVLGLYLLQRVQQHLWLSLGFDPVRPDQAWNTAIAFVTNTNWQSYSGEQTMGHLVQMAGLAVQNFVSAAVGMSVAIALVRGFARQRTDRLGELLGRPGARQPAHPAAAVVRRSGGHAVRRRRAEPARVHRRDDAGRCGATDSRRPGRQPGGDQGAGTNGGGFFNANSAHPFEGPTAWVSLLQVFLMLVIPFSLPRTFGRMVRDERQGLAIAGVMATPWTAAVLLLTWAESAHPGTALRLAGAATEGKEVRFGVPLSTLFAGSTTLTSTGAVNSFHDSFTALGGGLTLFDMMLGEIAPGGVGSGLYGMLVLAVVAVFVAGLMVGRTPEYLRKKIGPREMKRPRSTSSARRPWCSPALPWRWRCRGSARAC
ncbi:hypothetical protein GCM10025868_45240 [Angustibacter aerolatus]|uniref:Potassium-transporting ATPase subunit A n=1 Tax=Angustibacter aerolatus TaxID=1162965 RepID=A0ABQ6JPM5_9ACTN|nr:hypothetical protein GCM10025868_45240 [Angustibacter aerolatus]